MFDIKMPPTFRNSYDSLMGILNLEVYNIGSNLKGSFDLEDSPPSADIERLCSLIGFDSKNFVENEGNLIGFMSIYVIMLGVLSLLKLF